jgi:hypothetical protein
LLFRERRRRNVFESSAVEADAQSTLALAIPPVENLGQAFYNM